MARLIAVISLELFAAVKYLEIMRIEPEAHIVLVKGSGPGKSGSLVYMRKCR